MKTSIFRRGFRRTCTAVLGAAACTAAFAAPADAQTLTGWTAPTPPGANGVIYMHNSSITNSPTTFATTNIYTMTGVQVPRGYMGARARLFKSGILCEATAYAFNTGSATQLSASTTAYCGPGWYNSHGVVQYWGTNNAYSETFTFPSDPLESTQPAVNARGETFGSGETATADADLPDLVAAFGSNGEQGYVKATDLAVTPPSPNELPNDAGGAPAATIGAGTEIPLYESDGTTIIGSFTITEPAISAS